jgi:hypothetical protein
LQQVSDNKNLLVSDETEYPADFRQHRLRKVNYPAAPSPAASPAANAERGMAIAATA